MIVCSVRQTGRSPTMKLWTPPTGEFDETHLSTEQQAPQAHARLSGSHGQPGRARGTEAPAREGPQTVGRSDSRQATRLSAAATAAKGSQRFLRSYRLRKRAEFLALQREGRRRTAPHFIVITRTKETAPSRLGVTTSCKVGNAPERNQIRRLVREFFRRSRAELVPPRDVLVIARPGAAGLGYWDVHRELSRALGIGPAAA